MSDFLLEVTDVEKSYGSKLVLDDIDLRVKQGEICSVVGPSGCGKSTLLRLVLGQETPTKGTVKVAGEVVTQPDPTRGIVYQRYSLFPHLSVLENVLLGPRLMSSRAEWKKKKDEARADAISILGKMRLAGDTAKYPHELSGGMQQRVAIAQALIMRPRVLLMDEPFGALDPGTKEDVHLFLLELWEEFKLTIFLVTHDLEEALFLSTRLIVLSQFYTDDRAEELRRGARIVSDLHIKDRAASTTVKSDPDFVELVAKIRKSGFEPEHLQHMRDFNLSHPDSWRTVRAGEMEE